MPPEILPCFTIVADAYRDPRAPVQFQNCSEGAEAYLWEFGDGTTSTEVNPTHTYAAVGEYYVNLTAINGDYDERTQQTLRLGYPSITKVRVLRVPVMNRHGLPFDPDGSGLELRMVFYRAGQNGAIGITQTTSNATLPVDLNVTQPLSIAPPSLRLQLRSGNADTIASGSFGLDILIDSPIEHFENDSLEFEIVMEAYR